MYTRTSAGPRGLFRHAADSNHCKEASCFKQPGEQSGPAVHEASEHGQQPLRGLERVRGGQIIAGTQTERQSKRVAEGDEAHAFRPQPEDLRDTGCAECCHDSNFDCHSDSQLRLQGRVATNTTRAFKEEGQWPARTHVAARECDRRSNAQSEEECAVAALEHFDG